MKLEYITIALIINSENELGVIKRAKDPFKNYWAFCGGIGGSYEARHPYEAVKEEVRGDLRCEYNSALLIGSFFDEGQLLQHFIFTGTINQVPNPNTMYVSEFRWAKIEDLVRERLAFDHNRILEFYLEQSSLLVPNKK